MWKNSIHQLLFRRPDNNTIVLGFGNTKAAEITITLEPTRDGLLVR
jgi:hypothetical protein